MVSGWSGSNGAPWLALTISCCVPVLTEKSLDDVTIIKQWNYRSRGSSGRMSKRRWACASRNAASASAGVSARAKMKPR